MFPSTSNSSFTLERRRDALRGAAFGLLLLVTFALCAVSAHGQAVGLRWDLGAPGGSGVTTVTGSSGYEALYAVPNATLAFCSYPATISVANGPCTNLVTTYTDLTLGTACSTSTQIVLQGSVTCQATSDASGDVGVNLASGGTYTYTLTVNGVTSGPFTVSLGIAGGVSTPVTTPVSCPTSTLFPITSEQQAFAVALTANCTASALTATSITPPGLVIFQITESSGGGDTFSWPSNTIGGAQIATGANAVTTQAFSWNGTHGVAIGPAVYGAGANGPITGADTINLQTGIELAGSYGPAGDVLQSTGSGTIFAPSSAGLALPNNTVTGTTLNKLTKATGAPSSAVIAATTDTSGILGITTTGAGTSGTATIQTSGKLSCVFDGSTTAGDYVQISSTVAGDCHDSGVAPPSTPLLNSQVLGQALADNSGAGTYPLNFYGPGHFLGPMQGTDTKVLSSGTNSGVAGATLCVSSNGGATTSGCGFTKISTGSNSSVCSTSGSAGATCTTTVTISPTQPDTNFIPSCIGIGPSTLTGSTAVPIWNGVTAVATNSITVQFANGTSESAHAATYSEIQCAAIHP